MATRQVLWPQLPSATDEPWAWSAGWGNIFGGYLTALSAVGKYTEWQAALPAGDCIARILTYKSTNRGIYSLKLDGVEVGQVDLYAASGAPNVLVEVSFSVASAGVKTVRWECVGKNASSTHYVDALCQIELVPSGTSYAPTDALLPGVVDVPPYLYSADSGTVTWVASIHSSRMWGGHLAEITSSANWWIEWSVWLPAGTFDLGIVAFLGTNYGIVDFTLDGSPIGTVDFYDPVGASNALKTLSGISVGATGLHTLRLTCTSKNASSSNKFIGLNWMQFVRTAAAGLPVTRGRETIELYPWMRDAASGAVVWTYLSSSIFYGHAFPSVPTIGNYLEWVVDLSAGTWEAEILHSSSNNYAIAHLLLDGVDQGQADFYLPSLTYNQRSTIGFTVGEAGLHTLRLAANSKNASSSNYYLPMQLIRLTRTGD